MANQLEVIVKESGLETTKAQFILSKFQGYFEIASLWEQKAKAIVVTDGSQITEMQMAKTGRLFLRDKRIALEKARKELKEQALREGKAIDGIANVLKALIIPTEKYLERQEKFVEFKEAAEEDARRKEVERRMEEERIAEEKAKAEEQERIRLENEKLKAEAAEREKQAQIEREQQEKLLADERAKAAAEKKAIEDKAKAEREAVEKAAKIERDKQAKILAEQKAKEDKEAKEAAAEKKAIEKRLASQVECPFCHARFTPDRGK